jgi:hypothetical protein
VGVLHPVRPTERQIRRKTAQGPKNERVTDPPEHRNTLIQRVLLHHVRALCVGFGEFLAHSSDPDATCPAGPVDCAP